MTTARLGLALFAASLGALVAMPLAGRLCERVGSRGITVAGLLLGGGSLVAASVATDLVGLSAALFGFGAGFGAINVAVNAQGVALERVADRSILSSFHAAFSAGGLVGAGTAAAVAAAGVGVQLHYIALFVVLGVFALAGIRYLLPPEADDRVEERAPRRAFARPPRAILVLGAATFCTMLAEGAAVDWSAVYLSRSFGAAAGVAALAYTAFAFMMMTSRAIGDRLNRRLGPVTLARSGGAVATIGLGLALLIGSVPVAIVGFAAMGAGLGVVDPGALPRRRRDLGRLGECRPRRRLDDRLVRLPRRPARDRLRGLRRRAAGRARHRRSRNLDPCGSRGQRRAGPAEGTGSDGRLSDEPVASATAAGAASGRLHDEGIRQPIA